VEQEERRRQEGKWPPQLRKEGGATRDEHTFSFQLFFSFFSIFFLFSTTTTHSMHHIIKKKQYNNHLQK